MNLTLQPHSESHCRCQLQGMMIILVNIDVLAGLFVLVAAMSTICFTCNTIPTLQLLVQTGHFEQYHKAVSLHLDSMVLWTTVFL